jgi:hypothetical protein
MPDPDPSPGSVESRRFYVVWSPQGGPPVVRIPTFQQARTAAYRLSLRNPTRDFFVLQSCWGKLGEPANEADEPEPTSPEPEAEAGP